MNAKQITHRASRTTNACEKKVVCFQYASVCRQMGLEYVKGDKFEKGNKDKWPKHKAVKDNKDD